MIGVFDSGDGGLTVLKALVERLPEQDFLYLGDHARAPIGGRDPEDIYNLTVSNVDFLFDKGCRLVLLACNTASAVALRRLQQTWLPGRDSVLGHPGRRVLGVLVPVVEAIAKVPWHVIAAKSEAGTLSATTSRSAAGAGAGAGTGTAPEPSVVAIFATRRTVESGAYPLEIALRAPQVEVIQQACPHLVARIEADAPESELNAMVRDDVDSLLAAMAGRIPDTAVLGCTHYPLVATAFAAALPGSVRLLDQPTLVAESLAVYLQRHQEFGGTGDGGAKAGPAQASSLRFLTTGAVDLASARASRFFGRPVTFEGCSF
jgi:glutamate racemase